MFDISDFVEAVKDDPEGEWKKGQLFSVIIPNGDGQVMKEKYCLAYKVSRENGDRDRKETFEIAWDSLKPAEPQVIKDIIRRRMLPLAAQIDSAKRQLKILEAIEGDSGRLGNKEKIEKNMRELREVIA